MENTINQAFAEVYDIINHMEKVLYNKIPQKFMEMLYNNKDNSYKVNINYQKSINEQDLLQETRVILSLIYRDYICSSEMRNKLIEFDKEQLKKEEELLRKKYSIDFEEKNKKIQRSFIQESNIYPAEIKQEKWYKKIINKVLMFFKI